MGNACGAGSSGAVREQRAKEGSAEQMCKRRGSSVITDRKIKRHDVRQDYDLGKLLGEGAFGKVHAGTLKRSESEKAPVATTTEGGESPCPEEKCERAIKFLGVAALKATGVDDEINTMRRVSHHHNIVKLYDCYLHGDHFVMALELCRGGELFDRIVAKQHYSEREARKCFAQMVEAIGHCHAHEIVHRDLKPENLLYADVEGTPNGEVIKLADFGLASIIHEDQHLKSICGSPGYLAPEILTRQGYGKEVDMWTCGVILYVLLAGYPPFWDPRNRERVIEAKIKKAEYVARAA